MPSTTVEIEDKHDAARLLPYKSLFRYDLDANVSNVSTAEFSNGLPRVNAFALDQIRRLQARLSHNEATAYACLRARACAHVARSEHYCDPTALTAATRLATYHRWRCTAYSAVSAARRAQQLDNWITACVETLPRSPPCDSSASPAPPPTPQHRVAVIELGVGLSTRFARLATLDVDWFEVDTWDMLALRDALLPASARHYRVAAQLPTLCHIHQKLHSATPPYAFPIFVAEAVLGYLAPEQILQMLQRIRSSYSRGALIFDTNPRWTVRSDSLHTSSANLAAALPNGHAAVPGWLAQKLRMRLQHTQTVAMRASQDMANTIVPIHGTTLAWLDWTAS